jgi:hypothetical protein
MGSLAKMAVQQLAKLGSASVNVSQDFPAPIARII